MIDPKALVDRILNILSTAGKNSPAGIMSGEIKPLCAEITRQSLELAALRLAVEGARKAIEDAPHAYGCAGGRPFCPDCGGPIDCHCPSFYRGVIVHERPCNCFKSRTLALLPAPGEPSKLMEAMRNVVAARQVLIESGDGTYRETAKFAVDDALDALCAMYLEGK